MVQGERVTKAFLSKKIKKILKNEAKIKRFQFDLEKAYADFDQRITTLERKKNLKPKEVEDAREDYGGLGSAEAQGRASLQSLQGNIFSMQQQESIMKQQLGASGSMFSGQQGNIFSLLTGIHFPKPPWM